jgi:hypothetical protein
MSTKKWFGGAVVLSAALSLALAGGVYAQSQERGYGSGSGAYGSGQGTGSGSQKNKKISPPAKCESKGPVGVCAPTKSASPKTTPSTGGPSGPETSK